MFSKYLLTTISLLLSLDLTYAQGFFPGAATTTTPSYSDGDDINVGAIIGGILGPLLVILIIAWVISKSLYVVHQAEGIVIERLGKYNRVLDSGPSFIIPFVDAPRQFTWRRTEIKAVTTWNQFGQAITTQRIVDDISTSDRIDLRESVFNFLSQEVYTKDTVLLDVNALMYYSIYDVKKAIYEVDDLQSALSNTAQTQLKEVFGNMTFSEALESQKRINDHLAKEFSKLFYAWGISVHRMELLDLVPKQKVREQMMKQMVAERERRGDFIRSEGAKAAMRLKAEGSRLVSVNMGLAQQEATRKKSEGESGARVEMARAEGIALDTVAQAIQQDKQSQTEYMLGQKYIDFVKKSSKAAQRSMVILPYSVSGLTGCVGGLAMAYGKNAKGGKRVMSSSKKTKKDKKKLVSLEDDSATTTTTTTTNVSSGDAFADLD